MGKEIHLCTYLGDTICGTKGVLIDSDISHVTCMACLAQYDKESKLHTLLDTCVFTKKRQSVDREEALVEACRLLLYHGLRDSMKHFELLGADCQRLEECLEDYK